MNKGSTERANRKPRHSAPATARRVLKRMWSKWKVLSQSDGTMLIVPTWRKHFSRPGVLTRMYSAAMVDDVLTGKRL